MANKKQSMCLIVLHTSLQDFTLEFEGGKGKIYKFKHAIATPPKHLPPKNSSDNVSLELVYVKLLFNPNMGTIVDSSDYQQYLYNVTESCDVQDHGRSNIIYRIQKTFE
jgi:hypothetical protein